MRDGISRRRWIPASLAITVVLGLTGGAFAHEGHHHQVMGTVKMVHENHLMVTTTEDEEKTFVLSEKTKYLRGQAATTKKDVGAGERAVVMYETKDGADHALEVKLGEKKP